MSGQEVQASSAQRQGVTGRELIPELNNSHFAASAAQIRDQVSTFIAEPGLNPMFCDWVSADLRDHQADGNRNVHTNRYGQPVLKPAGVHILSDMTRSVLAANLRLADAEGPDAGPYIFTNPPEGMLEVMPANEVIKLAKLGFSGVCSDNQGGLHPSFLLRPLPCVWATFASREGTKWQPQDAADVLFPLKHGSAALFPLVGELHSGGEPLSVEVQERLGLRFAGMPASETSAGNIAAAGAAELKCAEWPMFVVGGRGLMLLANAKMPIRVFKDGGHEFAADMFFTEKDCPSNGPDSELRMAHIIAFGFTGVGLRRYVYHLTQKNNEKAALQPGEAIIEGEELPAHPGAAFVQRTCYAGKSGIFLDLLHQTGATAPTGGLTTGHLSVERDRLLWRKGAIMSGVSFSVAPWLTRDELDSAMGKPSGLAAQELQVTVRAYFDDTHRLDLFVPKLKAAKNGLDVYSSNLHHLMLRDFREDTPENRQKYLAHLGRAMGHNLKILLGCGFTINNQQPTCDNLSIYGGLVDSENLLPMSNRYQAFPLVENFVSDLFHVAKAAGLSYGQYVASGAWDTFTQAFLGADSDDKLRRANIKFAAAADDAIEEIALGLALNWVKASLRRDRKYLGGRDLARFALNNSTALEIVAGASGLPAKQIKRALKDLSAPLILITQKGGMSVPEHMNGESFAKRFIENVYIVKALQELQVKGLAHMHAPSRFSPLLERDQPKKKA